MYRTNGYMQCCNCLQSSKEHGEHQETVVDQAKKKGKKKKKRQMLLVKQLAVDVTAGHYICRHSLTVQDHEIYNTRVQRERMLKRRYIPSERRFFGRAVLNVSICIKTPPSPFYLLPRRRHRSRPLIKYGVLSCTNLRLMQQRTREAMGQLKSITACICLQTPLACRLHER